MRLWHYKLIPALPRQQLIAQWRECCCIMKNIAENGTPNHILVNKVLNYSRWHFYEYTQYVVDEINNRNYRISDSALLEFMSNLSFGESCFSPSKSYEGTTCLKDELFDGWHTQRYFKQCYYNLQEKYDCGGITDEEWVKIENVYEKEVFADAER